MDSGSGMDGPPTLMECGVPATFAASTSNGTILPAVRDGSSGATGTEKQIAPVRSAGRGSEAVAGGSGLAGFSRGRGGPPGCGPGGGVGGVGWCGAAGGRRLRRRRGRPRARRRRPPGAARRLRPPSSGRLRVSGAGAGQASSAMRSASWPAATSPRAAATSRRSTASSTDPSSASGTRPVSPFHTSSSPAPGAMATAMRTGRRAGSGDSRSHRTSASATAGRSWGPHCPSPSERTGPRRSGPGSRSPMHRRRAGPR